MTATAYVPVSITSESLSQAKLQQMANNDQWLFENSPRVRYNYGGIVRDSGLKIISGKVPTAISATDYTYVTIYFGSFFSASCKPIVTATAEAADGQRVRRIVNIQGISGEVDNRGFLAHVTSHQQLGLPNTLVAPGWVHFTATGF